MNERIKMFHELHYSMIKNLFTYLLNSGFQYLSKDSSMVNSLVALCDFQGNL